MIGDSKRNVVTMSHMGRPVNNYVLVKVQLTEEAKSKSGLYLGNADWDVAGHLTRHGTVVATPDDGLKYMGRDRYGAEWDTVMVVQQGDEVFWGIMSAYDCPIIQDGDSLYFLIKYHDLICVKFEDFVDGSQIILPLNGYVLCDPYMDDRKMSTISLPPVHNKQRGIVKYTGAPNAEYFMDAGQDAQDVSPGDIITLWAPMLTELEDPRYVALEPNLSYVQRRWIVARQPSM